VRFSLIDRIVEFQAGERVTATKCLSLSEEYLADHFPRFPVMPGVMMLEAMFQAGSWLVRLSEDFEHTIVVLREARNVKFADFVEPGEVLTVTVKLLKQDEETTTLKAEGSVDGKSAVSARLILERYNLADRIPSRAATDQLIRRKLRRRLGLICDPAVAAQFTGSTQ
jgi:3-hydroxyacyl-[acyl-carrier-protein] dehydratase